jgi:hypothetical protein
MTLTEFLQARIAEDEHDAHSHQCVCPEYVVEGQHFAFCSQRVWAQCAALKRIVQEWETGANRLDDKGRPAHLFDPFASALLKSHAGWLRILASVYADHPDYQPEWRP